MDLRRKLIVVVGAGTAGLVAIKSCLEENLRVICYEQTADIGGLWRYRPEVVTGQGSVMKSTVMNTSKEMSSFSDFAPPADFPNFMHHSKMLDYLRMYAQHFDLSQHIRLQHDVISVTRAVDFAESGKWLVKVRNTSGNEEVVADGVMVCTGHHGYPVLPSLPGLENFRNRVLHAHSFRNQKAFDGQTVLVVGSGNSGVDVAVELSLICKQVYLSSREGSWILHRLGPRGEPLDSSIIRRFLQRLKDTLPFGLCCTVLESIVNRRFNHNLYGLQPQHRILSQYPTTCDRLPGRIISGTVVIKRKVASFTQHGVVFEGEGDREHELDSVIMATGYQPHFPYLQEDVLAFGDASADLYKLVVPPHLEQPTLGVIGLVQPFGAYLPVVEMQCRWFVQAICGNLTLPNKGQMSREIAGRKSRGHKTVEEVFWIPYIDDLAKDIGVDPDLSSMTLRDPSLFRQCFFGPCLPYQYRLRGPHQWKEARQAILTSRDRVLGALQTRKTFSGLKKTQTTSVHAISKVIFGCVSIIVMAFVMSVII